MNGVGRTVTYKKKRKKETGPLSYTIYKNKLKSMKDLNVRPETIKLEESTGSKL